MSNCGDYFRLFTHYGRLDDLTKNANAGKRECRHYSSQAECDAGFLTIYKQKTSKSKGYKPVNMAASKIGSIKAQGQNAGAIGKETKKRSKKKEKSKTKSKYDSSDEEETDIDISSDEKINNNKNEKRSYTLHKEVIDLVELLYEEAKSRIEHNVDVTITYVLFV